MNSEKSKIDNQQESSDLIKDLSWLGGILDGEGTLTLRFHNRKNKTPIVTPVVSVVNTDEKIINEIMRIYKENNIAYWVSARKATKNWKKTWSLQTVGLKRCSRFVNLIEEYLIGKRENAEIIKRFCNKRLDDTTGKHRRPYYDKEDYEMLVRIKSLHGHKGLKSSETIRQMQDNLVKI